MNIRPFEFVKQSEVQWFTESMQVVSRDWLQQWTTNDSVAFSAVAEAVNKDALLQYDERQWLVGKIDAYPVGMWHSSNVETELLRLISGQELAEPEPSSGACISTRLVNRCLHDLWSTSLNAFGFEPSEFFLKDRSIHLFDLMSAPGSAFVTARISIGTEYILLVFPKRLASEVLPSSSAKQSKDDLWDARKAVSNSEQKGLRVEVQLGAASVELGRLIGLQRGDVIKLDRDVESLAQLIVDNTVLAEGVLGRSGARMAVKVREQDKGERQ